MRNKLNGLEIENKEKLTFTKERKFIASVLGETFETLDTSFILEERTKNFKIQDNSFRNIYVIGFGKAALTMYSGLRENIGRNAKYSGIVIPEGLTYNNSIPELEVLRGTHPITSKKSEESTRAILERIKEHGPEDLIIVLISGGGSALFEVPETGFEIEEIGAVSQCLMSHGANIRELNIMRQSMSKVKGGKLAGILNPSHSIAYIVSDVPGDELQFIASGPLTEPDYSTSEVKKIIEKYSGNCHTLEKIKFDVDPEDKQIDFSRVETEIILKNADFVNTIANKLRSLGESVLAIPEPVTGDVHDVARRLSEFARISYSDIGKPVWIISGGETTVQVTGDGIGGRNCELALRLSLEMKRDENFTFASIGTDGIDGVSPAMGGITDHWFKEHVKEDVIQDYLKNSDSYSLLNRENSAIVTGYTGTNVSDVFILYYSGLK